MDLFAPTHLLLIFLIVVLLFGGRKIPEVMKGLGEGIRNFKDGMSGSQTTTQAPPAIAPATAPTGITAKSGEGQILLNWNASAGASSYNIKRSGASGGPYAQIASTASTTFTDGGLASGSKYFYVVSSYNPSGESANSAEVSGAPA